MAVSQHPSAEVRTDYAIGNMAPGLALAVATHLDFCRQCTGSLEPRVRWRAGQAAAPGAQQDDDASPGLGRLPRSLEGVRLGAWKRVGGGLRAAYLPSVAGLGEAVHLVMAQAGSPVPGAAGVEAIVLLQGGLQADSAAYQPGDFLHLAVASRPPLRAGAATPCLCLIISDDTVDQPPFRNWGTRGRRA